MADYNSIYGYGTSAGSGMSGLASPLQIALDSGPLNVLGDNSLTEMTKIPGIDIANGGIGMNLPTLQMGFSALNSIGNLYAAFQANKLAKKQFDYTKKVGQANLTNSIQSYNTTLADRLNSRGKVEGTSGSDVAAQIADNSLKDVIL